MKKDPKVYVEHILESIVFIEQYIKSENVADFEEDQLIQDAVLRRLAIIGEAVKNLPEAFKLKYSEIPWKYIAGMRDVLIHDYFGVDVYEVWDTIQKDLPELKKKLIKIRFEN